ncbi:MAG: hypothetical protein ACRD37_05100, partial [Candidatus Acidiferrales bacterium]
MTQSGRIPEKTVPVWLIAARVVSAALNLLFFFLPVLLCAALLFAPCARAQSSRHSQAKAQYDKAQQMRHSLEAEPQDNRTLAEYKKVVA